MIKKYIYYFFFFLISSSTLFISSCGSASSSSSQAESNTPELSTKKFVLIEEFSGTWCSPGFDMGEDLEEIIEEYEESVFVIRYPTFTVEGFGNQDAYFLDIGAEAKTEVSNKYTAHNITEIPTVIIDGLNTIKGYNEANNLSNLRTHINNQLLKEASVNITVEKNIDTVSIEITPFKTLLNTQISSALIEYSYEFSEALENGQTVVIGTILQFLGKSSISTLNALETETLQYDYKYAPKINNRAPSSIGILTKLTQIDSGEVLQTNFTQIDNEFSESTGQIEGNVIDTNNNGISNIQVQALLGSSVTIASSNAQGEFTFDELPVGKYTLEATDSLGNTISTSNIIVSQDSITNVNNLQFVHTAAIQGTVNNASDEPISGAVVILLNTDKYTTTNTDGEFEFNTVTANHTWTIQLSQTNYETITQNITAIEPYSTYTVSPITLAASEQAQDPSNDIDENSLTAITGRAYFENANNHQNINVKAINTSTQEELASTTTYNSGAYILSFHSFYGNVTLQFSKNGYRSIDQTVQVEINDTMTIENITLLKTQLLNGFARLENTDDHSNILVVFSDPLTEEVLSTSNTNNEGYYETEILNSQTEITITFTKEGYHSSSVTGYNDGDIWVEDATLIPVD